MQIVKNTTILYEPIQWIKYRFYHAIDMQKARDKGIWFLQK